MLAEVMARSGPYRANGADSQKRTLAEPGGQPVAKVSTLCGSWSLQDMMLVSGAKLKVLLVHASDAVR